MLSQNNKKKTSKVIENEKKRILLVCSDGGHLAQMLELKELFIKYNYLLVTEKTPATEALKSNYTIRYVNPRPEGQNRKLKFYLSILLNFWLAFKMLIQHKPKVVITTGSHTAVPYCILAKILGIKVVWILSYARINSKAKSASLIYPIADRFLVQWPKMKLHYKKALYVGSIY